MPHRASSHIAWTRFARLSALMLASSALATAAPAWANCDLTQPDVICDGTTGPNTTPTITGKRSVRFTNNETQGGTTGLTVAGDATNGANVTIDAGSSITATATTANALTLRGGSNAVTAVINGNVSTIANGGLGVQGIYAETTSPTGNINITVGSTSTVSASTNFSGNVIYNNYAIFSNAIGFGNTQIINNGSVIGGILASNGNSLGASAPSSIQIVNNGSVTSNASGFFAVSVTPVGTGNVDVINNGRITGSNGISVFGNDGSSGNFTVTANADVGTASNPLSTAVSVRSDVSSNSGTATANLRNASAYGIVSVLSGQGNAVISGTGSGVISNGASAGVNIQKSLGAVLIDITQDVTNASGSSLFGTGAVAAFSGGNGAISVNRSSGGGNITAGSGAAIVLLSFNGVGNTTAVGPIGPQPDISDATRLTNNFGTFAVTVGAGKTVRSLSSDGLWLFTGYSSGAAVADINGTVVAASAGVWGRGTRDDFTVSVASSGIVNATTGIDITTAADFSRPSLIPGDPTVYQVNITPTVSGLQLAGVLTASNAGTITGTTTGIRFVAGGTGTAVVNNTGTITGGTNAVTGSTAGTSFRITNSTVGIMNGAVNVTGSSVSTSLLTNSGTWNLGAGNSAFSGNVTNSGTLNMAGGAANTLTISGNLVFNAGSVFRVDVGATQALTDRVLVTGTASLAGSVAAIGAGGVFTPGRYTLLTANGGVGGTFSPLTTNPAANVSLIYDANNVFLNVLAGTFTTTTSERQSLVFATPTVTTNRTTNYSTQIVGRLLGGSPLYDQTFTAAFADTTVQNGVTAARAAITSAGGPGVVIGAPTRTASTTTSVTASASTFALGNTQRTVDAAVVTVGPATLTVGSLSTCNVGTLPSATRPTCTTGGTTVTLSASDTNSNTNTNTAFTIAENRTDTVTDTLRETYELNGQVVAVGSVHAEVQSGLFDLGGRLLGRMGRVEAGSTGWADVYGFRVNQSARRAALGIAGGVGIGIAPGLTLALGIDRGRIDIDVASALETGRVELTEIGGALRYDSGPFAASLALVQGFGNASTRRTIIGSSTARYDVRLTGVAFDLGYAVSTGGWTVRPEAGIDWVRLSTSGFTETDTLGLIVAGGAARQVRATAGLSVGRDFRSFSLSARARYLAVLEGSARSVPVAFALAPTRSLTMSSAGEPNGVLLGAAVRVPVGKRASLGFGYDGRLGGGYTSHTATASVRVAF